MQEYCSVEALLVDAIRPMRVRDVRRIRFQLAGTSNGPHVLTASNLRSKPSSLLEVDVDVSNFNSRRFLRDPQAPVRVCKTCCSKVPGFSARHGAGCDLIRSQAVGYKRMRIFSLVVGMCCLKS